MELFFDLVIVVAVAQAASGLHHALREGHVGAGVLAFPEAVTSPGTESWERFRFAVPGETTIADAIHHLGKPEIRANTSVVDGEIDVIGPPWTNMSYLRDTYRRAQDRGVPVIKVELLQWHRTDPARHGLGVSQYAKLVFRGDRLWYAITPPSPDEASPAQLARRHSQPAQSFTVMRRVGDLGHRVKVLAFPAQGVAYTLYREQIDARLVFPPADLIFFTSDEQPDEAPSPK